MSNTKLLVTVPVDSCGNLKSVIERHEDTILHLPLELYESFFQREESDALKPLLDTFTFVVYGSLRNAKFFMKWVHKHNQFEEIRNQVHFVLDEPTSNFLENESIPAIMPRQNATPIDILEFMLRISKEGKTLYPTADGKAEELPGLLQELQMAMAEFTVCKEMNMGADRLQKYKEQVDSVVPNAVLFHNRSSVTRTKTAFPILNLQETSILSGSPGVTNMLIDMGVEPAHEAEGTWPSIQELIMGEFIKQPSER